MRVKIPEDKSVDDVVVTWLPDELFPLDSWLLVLTDLLGSYWPAQITACNYPILYYIYPILYTHYIMLLFLFSLYATVSNPRYLLEGGVYEIWIIGVAPGVHYSYLAFLAFTIRIYPSLWCYVVSYYQVVKLRSIGESRLNPGGMLV